MSSARCVICPHNCHIPENGTGFCGVRENKNGHAVYTAYGKVSAVALDPIEKKPLYRFRPGSKILSIGGFGCNFRCPFCQNHRISLEYDMTNAETLSPEQVAALATQTVPDGNIGVAYTYNEPLIGYEFVYDCAKLVRDAGLNNVLVTNGYINREPLQALLPYIDAMNIDLKGLDIYKKLGGAPDPVKETVRLARRSCHVELTTLVIPGENEDDIEELAGWIAGLDPDIPLHLSRFFPRYQYSDREPASRETVLRLCEVAGRYLKNVFTGH